MNLDKMNITSRKVPGKCHTYEVEGVFFTAKSMSEAVRKWTRFKTEAKVLFKKLTNGITYTSYGYYKDKEDFQSRNCTLIFVEMTRNIRPEPKKKENR